MESTNPIDFETTLNKMIKQLQKKYKMTKACFLRQVKILKEILRFVKEVQF
jgi:hypothetical protein